jgi:hypothetical protein
VDYSPEINHTIEANAAAGTWQFSIHFQRYDMMYLFDLRLMVQRNASSGTERYIRRVLVTHTAPFPASRM